MKRYLKLYLEPYLDFLAIFALTILPRIFFFIAYPEASAQRFSPPFQDALRTHLWDFLWHDGFKPPLAYLLNAFVFFLFPDGVVAGRNPFLMFTFFLGALAAVFFYAACRRAGLLRLLAIPLTLLLSLGQISHEMMRSGSHYDHPLFFSTCFLLWATVGIIKDRRFADAIWFTVAASIFAIQSSIASVVLLGMGLAIGLFFLFLRERNSLRYLAFSMIAPFALLFFLSAKNFVNSGLFMNSNMGGGGMMTVMFRAFDFNKPELRNFLQEAKVPDWFLWCFDNAIPVRSADGSVAPSWDWLAPAYAYCGDYSDNYGGAAYPFDYTRIRNYLINTEFSEVLNYVDRDIEDMRSYQYRMANGAPRFVSLYSGAAQKAFKVFLFKHFDRYLAARKQIWPIFLSGFSDANNFEPIAARLEKDSPLLKFAALTNHLNQQHFSFYFKLLLAFPVICLVYFLMRRRQFFVEEQQEKSSLTWLFGLALYLVLIGGMILVLTGVIGIENNRYFRQVQPLLYFGFALSASGVIWILQKALGKNLLNFNIFGLWRKRDRTQSF